jgi:hypothetical protein
MALSRTSGRRQTWTSQSQNPKGVYYFSEQNAIYLFFYKKYYIIYIESEKEDKKNERY